MSRRRWLIVVAVVMAAPCLFSLPCTYHVRDSEPWVGSAASIRYIGLALQAYHEQHHQLPPAVVRSKDGQPLYSWRVLLLLERYLDGDAVHIDQEFHKDEPWDSPHNLTLCVKTPSCYRPTFFGGNDPHGLTRYQLIVGPGTAFERPGLTWHDFPDGLANTLLVAESSAPVPWAKPADLTYDPNGPLPPLGGEYRKPVKLACYTLRSEPGFAACFADGTRRYVPHSVGEATLRGFITRNGGETVEASQLD